MFGFEAKPIVVRVLFDVLRSLRILAWAVSGNPVHDSFEQEDRVHSLTAKTSVQRERR
jgi:hypothetical protein